MKDFLLRLTSRKFLLALAGLIVLAANREWTLFVTTLLGYAGVEGASDVAKVVKGQ